MDCSEQHRQIEHNGFAIVEDVLNLQAVDRWIKELDQLWVTGDAAIKNRQGAVYAARNVIDSLPQCVEIAKLPPLHRLLTQTLGSDFGLVRGLYFDKHPERTWTLPWHKDLTIAVKDNTLATCHFTKPTRKNGIPHVEGSESVLENMLTLRIHLDRVTEENGPLEVAVGSHSTGKQSNQQHSVKKILVNSGDVLAMRPMLSHASGSSHAGTKRHRRILHLEFSGQRDLPDGYQWHHFL